MKSTAPAEPKPYHHGDLRRGLVDAARILIEAEGAGALSLRAVARAAGVSAAAPYHHFKDKADLLSAVAHEGWLMLNQALMAARRTTAAGQAMITAVGVAYVSFALDHPALYRVMYDDARNAAALPDQAHKADNGAFATVRRTIGESSDPDDDVDLDLVTLATWCAAHGLAELASFPHLEPLKATLGGERAFLRAVFDHMALFPKPLKA